MNYYVALVGRLVVALLALVTVTFVAFHLPGGIGDRAEANLYENEVANGGPNFHIDAEGLNALYASYTNMNPGDSLPEQYVSYLSAAVRGDLGKSTWEEDPLSELVAMWLPWTVFVVSLGLVVSVAGGLGLGLALAAAGEFRYEFSVLLSLLFLAALPSYGAALFLQYVFDIQLLWLPAYGVMDAGPRPGFNYPFAAGILRHAALPVAAIALPNLAGFAVVARDRTRRVVREQHHRAAAVRGLSLPRLHALHAGRNVAVAAWGAVPENVAFVFGSVVVLEPLFNYQGLGYYLWYTLTIDDHVTAAGCFLVLGVACVVGSFVAELAGTVLDPRDRDRGAWP